MAPRTPANPQWRQLELALNLDVKDGFEEPEAINLPELVKQFDDMLAALPEKEQLRLGGMYLDQLSQLYHVRAMMLLDDWEEEYNSDGPRFDDELLLGLIKEHQTVDVSEFVKPAHRFHPPKELGPLDDEDSVFVALETEEAIALAQEDWEKRERGVDLSHDEDITRWVDVVQEALKRMPEKILLVELHEHVSLTWIELLLALLLGGFELKQEGHFYQLSTLWVLR